MTRNKLGVDQRTFKVTGAIGTSWNLNRKGRFRLTRVGDSIEFESV